MKPTLQAIHSLHETFITKQVWINVLYSGVKVDPDSKSSWRCFHQTGLNQRSGALLYHLGYQAIHEQEKSHIINVFFLILIGLLDSL